MPHAAPHPCNQLGCREVLPHGQRYCKAHQRAVHQATDRDRGSPSARGYGRQWRKVRAQQLAREPLCRECSNEGHVTAGAEVDHIDGNSHNNDPSNLRTLCKSHHSRRTLRDQGWGRGRQ
jgi:5-methylcytosine-specific restriction endonuclease McrA